MKMPTKKELEQFHRKVATATIDITERLGVRQDSGEYQKIYEALYSFADTAYKFGARQ